MPHDRSGGRTLSPEALNERRRLAVRLRLRGMTLAEVAQAAELSVPTVLSAMRAFEQGGWDAIAVRKRGRDQGSGKLLTPAREREVIQALAADQHTVWTEDAVKTLIASRYGIDIGPRTIGRYLEQWGLKRDDLRGKRTGDPSHAHAAISITAAPLDIVLESTDGSAAASIHRFLVGRDTRKHLAFASLDAVALASAIRRLLAHFRAGDPDRSVELQLGGFDLGRGIPGLDTRALTLSAADAQAGRQKLRLPANIPRNTAAGATPPRPAPPAPSAAAPRARRQQTPTTPRNGTPFAMTKTDSLTHLQRLEAESIHILREVVAEADNPVMLYSIGKDSAVMLHLARKAFFPAVPPFPLLHVDTRWKFRDMYTFRDRMARESGMDLLVHINPEGVEKDINPFTHGSAIHTDIMKTEGLKQALDQYGFDAAFGGARRDEEKSRAKERVFSFRSAQHRWDPKNQRPELWMLYNARKHKGESIRVFPLSNWTELDIWQYIYLENVPIVPLYYSAVRPVVERDGTLIMVDDERMPLKPGEVPMMKKVRFRTLGCYPLTGAIESEADTLPAIIQEMLLTKTSERQGRVIDHDAAASMEKKKQEGYF